MFDERRRGGGAPCGRRFVAAELEPVEAVRRQREQVSELSDARECRTAQEFDRCTSRKFVQFEFYRLRRARHIDHAENRLIFIFAQICEHLAVLRQQQSQTASAERLVAAALNEHAS